MTDGQINGSGAVFLQGGGETGALLRERDWSKTLLGPPAHWPSALKTAVSLMLGARQPVYIAWGPELISLYNDGYLPIVGTKHPHGFGKPFAELWAEIWEDFRPIVEATMAGEAHHFVDLPIPLAGRPGLSEGYFTFSYTPLRDDAGSISGFYCAATETTETVLHARRFAAERERQQLLLQQMPGFVAVLRGPEHIFEYVNDAYIKISGPRQFMGRTVRDVFPELEGQGFYELLDGVYATGERFVAEALPVTLSQDGGSRRFIDLIYEPTRDEIGAVNGIFVGGYDVTDRVNAEKALRSTDERYRTLFESVDVGFCIFDMIYDSEGHPVDYVFVEVNPAFAAQTGLVEAVGKRISELAPGHEQRWYDLYGEVARTGAHVRVEDHAEALGRSYEIYAYRVGDPEQRRVAALFNDVSDRRRSESRLRELNETLEERVASALAERKVFSDVIDSSAAAVTVLDPEYRIIAINKANIDAFEGAFGKRPSVGDKFFDLFADMPEHLNLQREIWERALSGEDFTMVGAFGDERLARRHYEVRFSPLRDGNGKLIGASSTSYDVTDRVQAEQQLEKAQEQLRQSQKMEAVGQLTGGIAHDFNNLLGGISGSLEMLEKRLAEGRYTGTERLITAAQDASRRAASLTQRLLAFSRRQTLAPKAIDANKLLAGMEDLIRRAVGPSVEIEVIRAGGLWATRADPSQVENSLLNLCLNARDAMAPNGGRLTIQTANTSLDERLARDLELATGEYVSLSVSDTGSGMTPEVIERAFDPFFTTKPLGQGTGLGLSMIYGFVRQSGGQVRIHSEVGKGTTICLYLPRYVGSAEDAYVAPEAPGAGSHDGETVLVIDDEPILRMLVHEVLVENGYKSLEAPDGQSGLKILQSDARIDLLVTDVGLPGGMNGRQVADAARRLRPDLKVLFITGYAENAVVRNGDLDPGMEVMTKPFPVDALANRIRDMIDR